uniref:Uncharacterized protein n=1 Tax=Arundo donax TaxID=35708 RepID=A0A0A8Y6X1_ARUDO
MFTKSLPLWIN